ncbi:MAG TPA: cell division protein FtsZ [Catalimonadaceae bacterium]|nr:cell division protein FtsZ [Catalimonadaceae bacterium]
MEERAYQFDLTIQPKSIIKVVGVGGGGSNAVNFMFNQGFRDVEFVVCNTDSQALKTSPVPSKIQLGGSLLGGLGAGAVPENGREAAHLSEEAIREMLNDGTKMVFITAGMGGGTGTGAAPVIAKVAKELGILTIGIVTKPFRFEGPRKNAAADKGIGEMRQYCDTVIEILNDKIRELFGNMPMNQAFSQADQILSTSAKSLSEIITVPGIINVDFKDIETTMKDSGTAVMGSALAKGENRALKAVQEAISSPLLNSNEIDGATKVLLAVSYGHAPELTMDEFYDITNFIDERTRGKADVIFGTSMDPELGEFIQVTVIATGFENDTELVHGKGSKVEVLTTRSGVADTHFGNSPEVRQPEPVQQPYNPQPVQPVNQPVQQPPVNQPVYNQPSYVTAQTPQTPQNQPNPNQNPYYSGNQPAQEPERPMETPRQEPPRESYQYVDINGNFQLMYQSPENVDRPLDKVEELVTNRPGFARQISRAEALRNMSANAGPRPNYDDPDFLKQNELPAYLRKNPNLAGNAPSAEAMSRYTINENNEILDNNRFLHGNVD